jgi:LmbE family N-acetylglucosaminyl deacetylase
MAVSTTTQALAIPISQCPDPLLGRTLVLIAHPDDELACATLLQRVRQPQVLIATDGAPHDPFFWSPYGTRDNYAAIRRQEVMATLQSIGVNSLTFLNDRANAHHFTDQALHKDLINALWLLLETVRELDPDAILAPAYEGGHPDHDTCSFLGAIAGEAIGVPVWEMPMYHRDSDGQLLCQEFLETNGNETWITANASELRAREKMFATYKSQIDLRDFVSKPAECYRPQRTYDYSRPPHSGLLNYEAWQWSVTGAEVSLCMTNCLTYLETAGSMYFHRALSVEPLLTSRSKHIASRR